MYSGYNRYIWREKEAGLEPAGHGGTNYTHA